MTAKKWFLGGAFAALLAAAAVGPSLAAPATGSTVTVQTLTAKLMKTPSFIGQTAAKLVRGDQLKFQEAKADWYKVTTAKGESGWINKSSIVEKAVALNTKPGGGTGGATADEVALAGRGFSKEVEAKYKSEHADLDFSHVDKIEALDVDSDKVAKFAAEGKIGGAQ
jgi:uncharacterized protein YgiM (DUF1202 family)